MESNALYRVVCLVLLSLTLVYCNKPVESTFNEYETYTRHISLEYFTEDPDISFDSDGVIKFQGEYNALKMSVYGIVNYEMYLKTKDVQYLKELRNQYDYLSKADNYTSFQQGKAISYPYNFNYNDLKAPWYSGLVNAVASSFMLRYAELENSQEAMDLSRKLVQYMVSPVNEQGAKKITDEGWTWIEEYPFSRFLPQVMNGNLSALIALNEFLQVEENEEVREVYEAGMESLVASFSTFDLHNWTIYSRGQSNKIRNHYLKLQIAQLLHLYNLSNNEAVRRQAMIWSIFSFGKDVDNGHKGYIDQCYNYAFPLLPTGETLGIVEDVYQRTLDKCNSLNQEAPVFSFVKTIPDTLRTDHIELNITSSQNLDYTVFYKTASSNVGLYEALWKQENIVNNDKFELKANWYQLYIVFENNKQLPEGIQIQVNGKSNFAR